MSQIDAQAVRVRLNLGCGSRIQEGWVNVDYAWGARIAKLPLFRSLNRRFRFFRLDWDDRIVMHDLTRSFPWSAESVEVIYTSHLLEHLTREQGMAFLRECHRALREGGVLRVVVPDLAWFVEEYRVGRLPAEQFLEKLDVLYGTGQSAIKRLLAPYIQFPHKCMYDAQSLVRACGQADFTVTVKEPFDSVISDISAIELADRVHHAVIVEGVK